MRKYQMKNPSDARIFINFKNKKNPVRFEYPDKQHAFNIILSVVMILWLFTIFIFLIGNSPLIIYMFFSEISSQTGKVITYVGASNLESFVMIFKAIYLSIIATFMPPLIVSLLLVSNTDFLKKMPLIQMNLEYFLKNGYNEVVVKNLKTKKYELPIFDNIFLTFKVIKDYSKYLEKVEITEYKFKCIQRKIFSKKKHIYNQTKYWKAEFYFKKVPKEGRMTIKFI